jgi:hypothetical protein
MIAFLIAVIAAAIVSSCGWFIDQRILRCQTPGRMIVALVLLGIATWLIALIQSAFWLKVPGAYGPVQYWGATGLYFMWVRVLAMFADLAGMFVAVLVLVATIVSLFVESRTPKSFRCIVPAIALAVYALAGYMYFEYEFFPSA